MLAVVIALFLWTGATAAMASAQAPRAGCPPWSRAPLARRTLAVPDDLPLAEAVRRAQEAEAGSIVTVTARGRPGRHRQRGGRCWPPPRTAGPWVPVSTVARTLERRAEPAGRHRGRGADPWRSAARPADEYLLVEDDGSIFGVLVDRRRRPRVPRRRAAER